MTQTRPLAALLRLAVLAALTTGAALPALAQDGPPEPKPTQQPAQISGLAGPYLAARMATVDNDFRAAARYFAQAAAKDPADTYLQDSALVALTSAGDVDKAVALSDSLIEQDRPRELARAGASRQLVRDGGSGRTDHLHRRTPLIRTSRWTRT